MDSKVEQSLSRARTLRAKFEQGSETRYLDDTIALDRKTLALCTPRHPKRAQCLVQLAIHIWTRYNQLGGTENLHEAIVLEREALTLCPPGHPGRSLSLSNLAASLRTRYEQLGGVEDLDEALALDRDALTLRPPGHPDRADSLAGLANDLYARHEQLGEVQDLNEAINLDRDGLAICPPGHPARWSALTCLAIRLGSRYNQLGSLEDLDEAIGLDRNALALRPPGHPERSMSLNNLAVRLGSRYNQLCNVEDLNEAIDLDRNALALHPPGHPHRSASLSNLANHLLSRYNQLCGVDDLEEAIDLDRDALTLHPPGHPNRSTSLNNLAIRLSNRYIRLGNVEDLNEAIGLDRSALELRPQGHPDRSTSLEILTHHICTRYKQLGYPEDRDDIFSLYTDLAYRTHTVNVSLCDLEAARAWVNAAEDFHHPTTLLAYETVLRLLVQHVAALPSLPQHLTLLKSLSSSLAVDAFSACLRNQSPTKAVELLEQGRGVFWSQLIRLRSPLDDIVASGPEGKTLADQFTRLTSLIRNALACESPGADQHDQVWRLNVELERVVSSIRELPGLSRFLLPSLFPDLQRAASGGPVIIVNASKYSCDALVVFAAKDPVHIPLAVTKEDVRELSSKLRTYTVRGKKSDVTRELAIILRELWDRVISPIVDFLRTTCPSQSRIWWCPTAEFSLLPLHAAGPYRKGQQSLSSLYISSYTPTLTALSRARGSNPPNSVTQKRFVAIGQANAMGTSQLASVGTELVDIGQRVGSLAMFARLEGQDSCISRVADEFSKNEWVHLACHGIPNPKEPFESAFALHDGHFTIQRIIQCDLKNHEFAYLSACHTTVGDEENPDEVIHLASAMQFAGFRSVIGTMWAVDDAETNKITSTFYEHMTNGPGHLDHTRAAFALRKTMRSVDVPFDQWILYVHIGA